MILLAPPLAFLTLLFAVPLAQVVWGSFFAPNLTFTHYARIWQVPVYGRVLWNTVSTSVLTTICCLILAYPVAYFLALTRPLTRQLLLLCVVIPFFLSILIRNYTWILLLQTNGAVNRFLIEWGFISSPLNLMYNEFGVLLGMVNILLPYMIFPLLTALMGIPPELKEASSILGANSFRTFCRITLPLSLPGVLAGSLLVFILSLGFFITPALLGNPRQMMISNLIEFNVRQSLNWPFAFALGNSLLVGTLIMYALYMKLVPRRLRAGTGD